MSFKALPYPFHSYSRIKRVASCIAEGGANDGTGVFAMLEFVRRYAEPPTA